MPSLQPFRMIPGVHSAILWAGRQVLAGAPSLAGSAIGSALVAPAACPACAPRVECAAPAVRCVCHCERGEPCEATSPAPARIDCRCPPDRFCGRWLFAALGFTLGVVATIAAVAAWWILARAVRRPVREQTVLHPSLRAPPRPRLAIHEEEEQRGSSSSASSTLGSPLSEDSPATWRPRRRH